MDSGGHTPGIGFGTDRVVAAFDDRVLVAPLDDAQRVRAVVERLREEGRY